MKIVRFNMTQNLKTDNNKKIIKSTMKLSNRGLKIKVLLK